MNTVTSWTVFFKLKPLTTIYTTVLVDKDNPEEEVLIMLAKAKIQSELGINIDDIAEGLGINDDFGDGWILVEMNDYTATDRELKLLPVNKIK